MTNTHFKPFLAVRYNSLKGCARLIVRPSIRPSVTLLLGERLMSSMLYTNLYYLLGILDAITLFNVWMSLSIVYYNIIEG